MATRLQQKEVRFAGFSTLPDDYLCKDGGMAFATGSVFEDGGLRSIPDPERLGLVVGEGAAVYIHHTTNYYHYLIVYQERDENGEPTSVRVYVVDRENMEGEEKPVIALDQTEGNSPIVDFLYECAGEFLSLSCIGNTLIISTSEDMYYFLCKPGVKPTDQDYDADKYLTHNCDHPYVFLGNKIPHVGISFALENTLTSKTFKDACVDKTDSEYADGDSAENSSNFTPLWSQHVSMSAGTTYSYDIPYPLTAGTYRVRGEVEPYAAFAYSTIRITTPTGTDIVSYRPGYQSRPKSFTLDQDYSGLKLSITPGSPESTTIAQSSGTIYLESVESYKLGNGLYYVSYTEDNYDAVMGCINKFHASQAKEKNRFIYPFFIRYATRLYDETVCDLSVPILMVPNSGYAPFVHCGTGKDDMDLTLYAFVATLKYRLLDSVDEKWKDVIQGIDVYVSQPVYPYDQGKGYDESEVLFNYPTYRPDGDDNPLLGMDYGYGSLIDEIGNELSGHYQRQDLFEWMRDHHNFGDPEASPAWRITQVAAKDEDVIEKDLCTVSSFYLLTKLDFDTLGEVSDDHQVLEIESGTLNGLEGREQLSDDAASYDSYLGMQGYSYNNRLHMFGGTARYRDVTLPVLMTQHIDMVETDDAGYYMDSHGYYITDFTPLRFVRAYVYIRTQQGIKMARTDFDETQLHFHSGHVWLFYPNNSAYKMIVSVLRRTVDDNFQTVWLPCYTEFELKEHDFLNGAYCFAKSIDGLCDWNLIGNDYDPPQEYDTTIDIGGIYVSEVDNPFVFLNSTAVTAGSGKVLALSTAAQAMSQGQFGQYPLYAFTDEGVWALSVADTGVYGTSHPITRDVVTNVGSITQLDSSVLFVTDRGIMQIAGSATACISEGIDGEYGQFDLETLPSFARVYMALLGMDEGEESEVSALVSAWTKTRFFDYIRTCGMVYDYTHQRVIVYNATSPIAYNYSLKDKQWCMMFSDIRATVLSYPDALVLEEMTSAQKEAYGLDTEEALWELVDLSTYAKKYKVDEDGNETGEEDDSLDASLFVTRPMKLDAPDIEKTLDSLVLRGYFQQSMRENHITGMVLYGSPDLFNWFVVGQAATREIRDGLLSLGHEIRNVQGQPYKYFRLVVGCKLDRRECVSGVSILYEPRDNNVLR